MTMIRTGDGFVIDNDNPLPIRLQDSAITLQTDNQNNLASTIQTHNAVSVALSSYSIQSTWIDCDGFDKLAVTFINDAATTSSVDIKWSNDGVTQHGQDLSVVASNTLINKTGITDVKARYAKVTVVNGDATLAHTMSAWAYLKA
jgi:hypothetical protein